MTCNEYFFYKMSHCAVKINKDFFLKKYILRMILYFKYIRVKKP